jgi:hypothetical protein
MSADLALTRVGTRMGNFGWQVSSDPAHHLWLRVTTDDGVRHIALVGLDKYLDESKKTSFGNALLEGLFDLSDSLATTRTLRRR